MTPVEAAGVVGYLFAGFRKKAEAETVAVWADTLGPWSVLPAREAARRAVIECQFFPSVREFLDLVEHETWRVKEEIDHDRLALPAGPVDQTIEAMAVANGAVWIRAISDTARAAVRHTPACSEQRREACLPGCPWQPAVEAAVSVLRAERTVLVPPEVASLRCRECSDLGLVRTTNEQGIVGYYPCPACSPDSHRRWEANHYWPNHDCDECRALRKGKVRR